MLEKIKKLRNLEKPMVIMPTIVVVLIAAVLAIKFLPPTRPDWTDYLALIFFGFYGGQIVISYHLNQSIFLGFNTVDKYADVDARTVAATIGYGILFFSLVLILLT